MSSERDDLIGALSDGLQPVKPVLRIDTLALLWFAVSAVYVVAVTQLLGPIRSNAFAQLATEPRFLLETLSGIVAIAVTSLVVFRAGIPGALTRRFAVFGAVLMLAWLSNYIVGLVSPALEPSMLGKRPHCVWETFIYALPPMAAGFVLVRRLYPLQPVQTAMCIGSGSGDDACPVHADCLHVRAWPHTANAYTARPAGGAGRGRNRVAVPAPVG